jgi:N-acetylmuramoyl-L-alanine amidase
MHLRPVGLILQCRLFGVFLLLSCSLVQAKSLPQDLIFNGQRHTTIESLAEREGANLQKDPSSGSYTISGNRAFIRLKANSRIAQVNGRNVHLGFPTIEAQNDLYVSQLDWQFILAPLLSPERTASRTRKVKTIVIDPGHGGKDPGAVNPTLNLQEKVLNLQVSLHLAKKLKSHGYRVFLTRKDDSFLTLEERTQVARRRKADLFLSIHFNASPTPGPSGIETFAYTLLNQPSTGREDVVASDLIYRRANRNDAANSLLAFLLQDSLLAKTGERDRGVKRARFVVIEDLDCPGALVELGFINHPETASKFNQPTYLETLSEALTESILRYSAHQSER